MRAFEAAVGHVRNFRRGEVEAFMARAGFLERNIYHAGFPFFSPLYREFFGVYTEKAWRMPCREISSDWAAQRISQANLWDAIHKAFRPPRGMESRGLTQRFYYPTRGGIGELATRLPDQLSGGQRQRVVSEPARARQRGVGQLGAGLRPDAPLNCW